MRLGVDPKVDYAFKKLFGNEDTASLLINILNAVILSTRPVTAIQIVLPHTDKSSPADKLVIADVKARDQGNRQFHLEMQWQVPWFFPKRMLFYWGRFHPQQLFEGENYLTLRPTISICFTNRALFPELDDHHLVFRLREEKRGVVFSDDLEIHLIQLPRFNKTAEQLTSALDRWCYFLRHGEDLDLDHLPASLDVPEIRRALEVLTVFTQDEREREIYELRLMAQRDQSSLLQDAKDRGLEEGLEKGLEKGALMGQVRLCQELLKVSPTSQAELSALSQEALAALVEQLRNQLLPNGN
jgi:predicted transposase/invertase (TIGR01784 family)